MYILVIMSVIAAVMFHKTALAKGYLSPRFWMYPIIVGNGLLLFVVALKWFVKTFMQEQGSPLLDAYFPLVDILAMVMFFLVIAKAWKQLKSIPPLVDSIPEEDRENHSPDI